MFQEFVSEIVVLNLEYLVSFYQLGDIGFEFCMNCEKSVDLCYIWFVVGFVLVVRCEIGQFNCEYIILIEECVVVIEFCVGFGQVI